MNVSPIASFELKIKKIINKPILLINPGCIKQGDLIFIYYNSDRTKHRNLILDNTNNISKIRVEIYKKNSFAKLFKDCELIEEIKCTEFKGKNINDMSEMFSGCKNLIKLDLSIIETDNVTNMDHILDECCSLKNFISKKNEMETIFDDEKLINQRQSESFCMKIEKFCGSLPLPNYQSTHLYDNDDIDDDDSVSSLFKTII